MSQILETALLTSIPFILVILLGIWLSHIFEKVRKQKCHYCKKKIGSYYDKEDGARFRELKDYNQIWSHTKCIPKEKLRSWRRTY